MTGSDLANALLTGRCAFYASAERQCPCSGKLARDMVETARPEHERKPPCTTP
jgi:hypothetical protein